MSDYEAVIHQHNTSVLRMKREQDMWEKEFDSHCSLCGDAVNMNSNAAILRHMNAKH